jgi:hypothetical protein
MSPIRTAILMCALLAFPACVLAGQPGQETALKPVRADCVDATTTAVETACAAEQRKAAQRQLARERRAAQRVARWEERKRMCRELGVRFDRSGLCW